jgi:histidinol-phosphate/aromatic aminotransferase/cobyric acid decarboxylase-like protein
LSGWQRIPENVFVDAVDEAIVDYEARHGRKPINVSHWDPSHEFVTKISDLLPITPAWDPVAYRYSYMIGNKQAITTKLGFNHSSVASLLTENGSMSIVAVANWLVARGIRAVRVLCPSYFVTAYSLRRVGIQVNRIPLERVAHRYLWPRELHLERDEALWVSNPVYNTGCYSLEERAEWLATISDQGRVVVLDEALALTPTVFATTCNGKRNFVGIYTPHKAICLNSFKFSIVVFNPEFDDFFDDWADVLFGGLSASAVAAAAHFISGEYETYKDRFISLVNDVRAWHTEVIRSYGGRIQTDRLTRGHFLSVYFPGLDATLGSSLPFIVRTIEETGTAFIPGQRSGFGLDLGFCFRVNLAQDSAQFRGGLQRLYRHLTS